MNQIYKIEPLRQQLIGIMEQRRLNDCGDKEISTEALARASGKPGWAVEAALDSAVAEELATQNDQGHWCLPALEAA